ncbi:mechanosensitive ion channel family protein [Wenzhouxiangella limi]|uniref:Small-conductance mechanosensitive channel n=1 Tax=Wenzhouxiangella limi TaxID=2707351 RepID=A0A845VAX0_9GAMM|nr:mechanosensitive ion channel family protein [Wenzhouxiangella limi]NDY97045.1 mechanosensitive ion channel [Wenzhouxiangella limi]
MKIRAGAAGGAGPFSRSAFGLALALTLWIASGLDPAWAQDDRLAAIEAKREAIEQIINDLDNWPGHRHDGMLFRVDDLARELGTMMLAYPIDELADGEAGTGFPAQLEWFQGFLVERYEDLQERIGQEQERFDEFDESSEAAISRAFQQDLRKVVADHTGLLVKLLELGERIGRMDEDLARQIRETMALAAEGVSGQILLDATTLTELRNMIRADPTNAELIKAERAIERKQVRNIQTLEQLVGLMDSIGLNAGSYRALLVNQRGSIGVDILDREVFMSLLGNRIESAKNGLLTQGPNVVFKMLVFLSIVAVGYLVAKFVQGIVTALLHRESVQLHRLMEAMLISLSFGIVFTVGLVVALSTIGISLVPMLAGLGVAGIVIGFALQDTLSNFASGWMILIYRPYDVDDHVIAGGVEGTVKRMNLVSTTIATFDNQRLVIPNSKIWGDVITNLTANRIRRLKIPVSIAYGEDLDRAEEILRDEVARHEGILRKPAPNVFVDAMEQSDILMITHAWVRTPDYWTLLRSLTKRIKQRLDREGIEIPFPQQDIYVRALPGTDKDKPANPAPEPENA